MPGTQSLSNRSPARSNRLLCNPALESQHFGSCCRTIEASIPVDGDIGDHAFVEPDFLDLAWHLADFVRSNVAELANNAPKKEWQSAAKGAVVLGIPGV